VDTAITLFNNMVSSTHITPNSITCSCLFSCLLKNDRVNEALGVIRYMKGKDLHPTEYMYTGVVKLMQNLEKDQASKEIYVELMSMFSSKRTRRVPRRSSGGTFDASDNQGVLMNVFLIFYAIDDPDIVCYNTLLSACARVGDVERAMEVFERMKRAGEVVPNAKTYAELLKCAFVKEDRGVSDVVFEEVMRKGLTGDAKIQRYRNKLVNKRNKGERNKGGMK